MIVNVKRSSSFDIYIGRENQTYNLPRSKWANPFIIGKHGTREEVVGLYRLWINSQPDLLKSLPEIRGKVLGCWCDKGQKCHGEVLLWLSKNKYVRNWFSNMLPFEAPLIYQGIEYKTSENFYQAMKLPKSRPDLRSEIASMSPFDAKKNIRIKGKYLWDSNWNREKSLKVMEYALNWKFQPSTDWFRKLRLTEDWELVEWNNWGDLFWGKDLETGEGHNYLGKILMNIREK